jgi:hypothetical protein
LTEEIAQQLVPKLRPKYLVLTEQRYVTVERIPLKTVEIWDAEHRRLVTAIEVLSPTNKRGEGRIEYAAKRQSIMRSDTHLIEIDLLRAGTRFPVDEPLPPAAYSVFVSRSNERPEVQVWPIALDGPLPSIPVPLLPEDADASLELQTAFATIHDFFRYDRLVNYAGSLTGPLTPEQAEWVEGRLRESGRR